MRTSVTARSRMRRSLALCAPVSLAAAAVVVAVAPARASHLAGASVQVLADLVALTACTAVALHTRGSARVAWSLVAVALACWLVGDAGLLATVVVDDPLPDVSGADIPWATFNLLTLVAVGLMFARLRAEHGWQGILDSAAMALALGVLGWTVALRPLIADEAGTAESVLDVFYPATALAGLAAVGWLVLRSSGGPAWLRWILVAFAAQFIGETVFVALTLDPSQSAGQGLSAVAFAACAWAWAFAALERLEWPQELWARRDRSDPPAWSHAIPAASTLVAVGVLAWGHGALGIAALAAAAIAAARYSWAIISNERLLSERAAEAHTDPLTGVPNRRHLARDLGRFTARARGDGRHLTALALDLDGFKAVNDTLGHAAGDRLLVGVAAAVEAALRPGDRLYRTGGDEFIVLLPDTGAGAAAAIAERLRSAVADAQPGPGPVVTASIGVAEGPLRRTSPPEALLDAADAALYRAKAEGRDRVVATAGPRPSDPGAVESPLR